MDNNISLGRKNKFGNVNLNRLNGGVKKDAMQSAAKKESQEAQEKLFRSLDKDNNNILDQDEISQLLNRLAQLTAEDKELSEKEAKKILAELNIKDVKKEEIFNFVKQLSQASEHIKSSQVVTAQNGEKLVVIEYQDDSKEIVHENESFDIVNTDEEETVTTSNYSPDAKIQKKTVKKQNGDTTVTEYANELPTKTVVSTDNGGTVTEVIYDTEGKKATQTVTSGSTVSNYTFNEAGEAVLNSKVENKGLPIEKQTTYTYNEDGTTTLNITESGITTTQVVNGGRVLTETTAFAGVSAVKTYNEEGGYTEVITDGADKTTTVYNAENKRISQEKVIDGETYRVEYDGQGNTFIIVQNGESPQAIAKKFGIENLEDLYAVNEGKVHGRGNRRYFYVGEEIKVPKELEADDPALKGRDSRDEAIGKYQDVVRRQEEAKEEVTERRDSPVRDYEAGTAKTFEEIAKKLYQEEGVSKPNRFQIEARAGELKELNPDIKNGELSGKTVKIRYGKAKEAEVHNKNLKEQEKAQAAKKSDEMSQGKEIATIMEDAIDENIGGLTEDEFEAALARVDKDNVVGVIKQYKAVSSDGEPLIEAIFDETYHTLGTRKKVANTIIDKLLERAESVKVKDDRVAQALDGCKKELDKYWSMGIGSCDTDKLVDYVNNLVGAIEAAETLTKEDKLYINHYDNDAIDVALDAGTESLSTNRDKLQAQLDEDGWCEDLWEGIKWLGGSEQLDEKVKADLDKFEGYINQLQEAQATGGEEAFKTKFKEIFGVEYDRDLVHGYKKLQEDFVNAQATSMALDGFNNQFKSSLDGTASLEVMLNAYADYLQTTTEGIEDGKLAAEQGIALAMQNDGIDYNTATEDQKKEYLQNILKDTQARMQEELDTCMAGKSFEQMENDLRHACTSVFGDKGDIASRVATYVESQQTGGAYTGMVIKVAGAIAIAALTGGTGLAALATVAVSSAALNATVDITDQLTSKNGLTMDETVQILKNASVDGAAVFAGGMVGKYAMMFKNANAFVQAGGRLVGTMAGDVSTGAAAEYLQTGTITIEGVMFEAIFSGAGNLVSLKQAYKAAKGGGSTGGKGAVDIDGPNGPKGDVDGPKGDVDGPDGPKGNDTPEVDPVGPTPENPQKMTFFESEVEVVHIESGEGGQKILTLKSGEKVVLDELDRPTTCTTPDGDVQSFHYKDASDKMPSHVYLRDKNGKIKEYTVKEADHYVQYDYELGKKYILDDKLDKTLDKTYLSISEYTDEMVPMLPSSFEGNMQARLNDCADLDGINALKAEVDAYKAKFGKDAPQSLIDEIAQKEAAIKKALEPKISPENPLTFKALGEDFIVVGEHVHHGKKVYTTADGKKLTLDEAGRIGKIQDGDISTFYDYGAGSGDMPVGLKKFNKAGKLLMQEEHIGGLIFTYDYQNCVMITKNPADPLNVTSTYMNLKDYPASAVIPSPEVFGKVLESKLSTVTDKAGLQAIKEEYGFYQANYGLLPDANAIFDKIKVLDAKLSKVDDVVKPHKPLSSLITGTSFDNLLKNFNVKKYGKKGLPLKYTQEEMTADLLTALNKIPDTALKHKLMADLNLEFHSADGKLALADIPKTKLTDVTPEHQVLIDILDKYTKQNEIMISDPGLKAEIENFVKDVPEFMYLIGKPQNSVHLYSVDSHTIQALQKSLKYADDINLGDEQKELLKMAVLLHDMGKKFKGSTVSDTGHQLLSAKYVESILDRFNYTPAQKATILKLVENHHWFKDFNKGTMSVQQVLDLFGDDIELAKIMAKADLESVSDDFHLEILQPGKKLSETEFEDAFKKKMDELNTTITAELIGEELPLGPLKTYTEYALDFSKGDKLQLGNSTELDLKDPTFQKLINELKEGESFAIGCTDPKSTYADIKMQIGMYADGVKSHHLIVTKKHGQIVIDAHGPVSVIKDIPTAPNSNPVIAKKIAALKSSASSISSKTLIVDGKPVQFEILHGTQGGSNKGYFVINKETGDLYYAKEAGPQAKAEAAAAKLYAAAGVEVPEVSLFKANDGSYGVLSKYIEDLKAITSTNALANDQFGMDVLLANWDAVCSNNTAVGPNGKAVMIDAGGSFDYHAHQSGSKPFGGIPTEIMTLLDPSINSTSANIFGAMSRNDLIKSLQKATSLKVGDITKILDDCGVPHYKDIVLARRKFMQSLLDEIKATPHTSGSMLDYVRKVTNSTLEKYVDAAKSFDELEDVKTALKYVNDVDTKNKLVEKIKAREAYLQAQKPKVVVMSEVQVENLLGKHGYAKGPSGYIVKKVEQSVKDKLYQIYGHYGSKIVSKIESPLSSTDIKNLQTMLNSCGGEYQHLFHTDVDKLIQIYRNIEHTGVFTQLDKMTPGRWEAVFNIASAKPITVDQLSAITSYKGSSSAINGALTAHKKHGTGIGGTVKEQIDNIQSYISTQVLDKPITVYRGEGYEVLGSVKLNDGSGLTLDQALMNAANGSKADRDALIDHILDHDYVATQERFMSTSMLPGHNFSGSIVWELEVQKGSKGVFLEGINVQGSFSSECELLLQKDSQILITDIEYKNNQWHLKGKVTN